MKALSLFLFLCFAASAQQTQPSAPAPPAVPNLPDDTVVAIFDDGVKFTMAEFKRLFAVLPPQNQQLILQDRKAFLEQWALMRNLSRLAEQKKLDQTSPFREQLMSDRMTILAQAAMSNVANTSVISLDDLPKYYEANKERYKELRIKAIYVAFGQASGGKKALTEEEAKAKAVKLLDQIRKGADFVKLVKENSDDETSREKDGDYGVIHPSDNLPDAFRPVLFSLKQGDVSEPVRQPGGYYLLRAEQVTYRPFEQVRDEIFTQLRGEKFNKWMAEQRDAINAKVQFPSPEFLAPAQPANKK
jgi:peptidyl-prolyl cis-trans isomerase C